MILKKRRERQAVNRMPADELKARRLHAGLTQAEMGERLGVDRVTILNWEHGHCFIPRPAADTIRRRFKLPKVY